MLGVFEAIVPIIASNVFTKLYNATAELDYPWYASFYFGTIGVVIIGNFYYQDIATITEYNTCKGILLTIVVYLGTRRKQITSEEADEDYTGDTKL